MRKELYDPLGIVRCAKIYVVIGYDKLLVDSISIKTTMNDHWLFIKLEYESKFLWTVEEGIRGLVQIVERWQQNH